MDRLAVERKLKYMDDYMKSSNASTGSKYDSNANVTQKNIATLQCELGKKDLIHLNRGLTLRKLKEIYGEEIASQYIKDIDNHIIYRHDETSLFPYCASISLYPFLLYGSSCLGDNAKAPQHPGGFIGGLANFLYMVASQFAGAIAIPEFLTYFDHFLRKEYGDNYRMHLDDSYILCNHDWTLRHQIEDWFQQFVYSINSLSGARNFQSPFTNIAYFDKYYFEYLFNGFFFPDGDEPNWESTKSLQKMFMKWFNKERTKAILTFPVETANILVENGKYKDEEMADFFAEMWAEGHSFFMYQSDSVDALASCCRLRNAVEENVFSYTLGAGGIETGSKCVITLNLNRIIQNWSRESKEDLPLYIETIVDRVHKYLNAWNEVLWDYYNNDMLPVYKAGFIDLDKQFLTIGVNGFVEAAEFLGIKVDPEDKDYKQLAKDILGTIKKINLRDKDKHHRWNTEFVPAENLAYKNYEWDKKDGYWVPKTRNMYNSYFYPVEDETIDPVKKFYYQGEGFATECDGGVALHNNLNEHLSKVQYRMLMDIAIKAGCNYFTFNIVGFECSSCHYISKSYSKSCPMCGSEELDYFTRVIGYLKKISSWSESRQTEFFRRSYYTLNSNKATTINKNPLYSKLK